MMRLILFLTLCLPAQVVFRGAVVLSSPTRNGVPKTDTNQRRVTLSWTASVSEGVTGYRVYRAERSGGPYQRVGEVVASPFVDATIASGRTYYYVVTAFDERAESGYSEEATAVVQAARSRQ